MRRLRSWLLRLASAFGAGRSDAEINEELQAHRDLLTADYVRSGMTPDAARRRAAAEFGSVPAVANAYRDRRGVPALEAAIRDGRMAIMEHGQHQDVAGPWSGSLSLADRSGHESNEAGNIAAQQRMTDLAGERRTRRPGARSRTVPAVLRRRPRVADPVKETVPSSVASTVINSTMGSGLLQVAAYDNRRTAS